jgi:DNA-binding MarR family transcriptional regulator
MMHTNTREAQIATFIDRHYEYRNTPIALENYLYNEEKLSGSAVRVFLEYWRFGKMGGNWQCNISAQTLQDRLQISRSSVERANSALVEASLITRINNGKSSANPFRQCVSTTKILFPKRLIQYVANERYRTDLKTEPPKDFLRFVKELANQQSAAPPDKLQIEIKIVRRLLNGKLPLTPDIEQFAAQVSWSILHGDMTAETYGSVDKAINTAVRLFRSNQWGEPHGMKEFHQNWTPSDLADHDH